VTHEGWQNVKTRTKYHYIVNGDALCCNWISDPAKKLEPFNPKFRSTDDCRRCWGLAYKRTQLSGVKK
jgi:hypothetical protein